MSHPTSDETEARSLLLQHIGGAGRSRGKLTLNLPQIPSFRTDSISDLCLSGDLKALQLWHNIKKSKADNLSWYNELNSVDTQTGKTPLTLAVISGCAEVIDFLIQLEVDPTVRNLDGTTAMHWASTIPNPSVLTQVLRLGMDINTIDWVHGQTPLHIACRMGNDRAAKILLESPHIKPNLRAEGGATPLILAIICSSNSELLRLLVNSPLVNLAQTDDCGRNAVWWAAHLAKTEFCSILLNGHAPIHPFALHAAAKAPNGLDVVNLLLAVGAQANLLDTNGLAPLHIAALTSNTAILSLLLAASNVDSNLLSRAGWHCAQYIVAAGSLGSLKGLLAVLPQSISLLTPDGSSLIHIAASRTCPKFLKYLLDYTASHKIALPSHTLAGQSAIDLFLASMLLQCQRHSRERSLSSSSSSSFSPSSSLSSSSSSSSSSDLLTCLQEFLAHDTPLEDSFLSLLRTSVMLGDLNTVQFLHTHHPRLFAPNSLSLSELIPPSDFQIMSGSLYLRVVEYLLSIGVKIDSYACLHLAAANGLIDFVKSFIGKWRFPVDCPSSGPLRCTPLMLALMGSHNETAAWLLSQKASLEAPDAFGRLPIHFAAQFCDDLDIFRRCLVSPRSLRTSSPSPYHSLAVTKIERCAPQKLQMLLKNGFDITTKNVSDETALHFACSPLGLTSLVQLLVAEGCNQVNPNLLGLTPLHLACLDSNPTKVGVLQFLKPDFNLQTKRTRSTPLHCALRARQIDIAEFLITHQLNFFESQSATSQFQVNITDKKGRTPLHWAASFGDAQLCRLLITEARANLRLADFRGQTPLHLAAKAGHLMTIKVLLSQPRVSLTESMGSNKPIVDTPDQRGRSALHLAMKYDQTEVATLLLSAGASVITRDNSCRNALHYAALSTNPSTFTLLWQYRHQISPILNSLDTSASTPLHLAVEKGSLSFVNALLACRGIDLNLKNQNGETPLAIALRCGFGEIVRAIESVLLHFAVMDPNAFPRSEGAKRSVDRPQIHSMVSARSPSLPLIETELRPKASTIPVSTRRAEVSSVETSEQTTPQAVTHPAKRFRSAVLKGSVDALNRFWRRYGSRLLYDINCCVDPARRSDWTALHQYASSSNSDCVAILLGFPFINVNPPDTSSTPLHEAVRAGSLACAYLLLEAGSDPHALTTEGFLPLHLAVSPTISEPLKKLIIANTFERMAADKTGKTVLHLSAQQGDAKMIECLIEAGVQIDLRCGVGITDPNPPLHLAVKFGHLDCVRLLLNAGADVNSVGAKNRTALHIAAGVDHIDILQLILQRKPQLEAKDEYGLTPFLVACRTGSVGSAEALITAGAAMEATDRDLRGALHQAVEAGAIGILSALVASKRLNIEAVDSFGFSPLHLALQSGNELIAIELTEKCKLDLYQLSLASPNNILGQTELHMAAASGCTSFVRMLLKVNVSRNVLDLKGNPPLFYALSRNHLDTAAILLDSPEGSLDLVPVRTGKQPLSIACEHGWTDCADHLLRVRNHSPNWQNADGSIALHACAKSLSVECLQHILQGNVDIDRLSGSGFSALHLAILQTSIEHYKGDRDGFFQIKHHFVQLLLDRACSLNLATKTSLQTPLHLAAALGDVAILRMLVDRKASLDEQDHQGATALLLAVQNRHRDCYLELILRGADPHISAGNATTVLHELITIGDYPLAYLLLKAGAKMDSERDEDGMSPVQICCAAPPSMAADIPDSVLTFFGSKLLKKDIPSIAEQFLERLLKEYPDIVRGLLCKPDKLSRTAAHHAARVGCLSVLELAFRNGVSLDAPDTNRQTPIHFAAAGKHLSCVKFLIKHLKPASCAVLDAYLNSALHYACDSGALEIVHCLLPLQFDCTVKNADGSTPLLLAVASGNKALVSLLLTQRFDATAPGLLPSSDRSLLHLAPSLDIASLLLGKLGSLAIQKDQRGCTPLHYAAVFATEVEHLTRLIEKGASPADRCLNGWFPVHYAALAGNVIACGVLFPPVLTLLNSFEEKLCPFSPLHCAVLSTSPHAHEVTRLLLGMGARVNDRDPRGQSPLHYAAARGCVDLLGILLAAKDVSIDPQDWGGITPLHLAAMEDHCAAVRLLAIKGANLCARTINGATPLHIAAYANRIEVIHLLLYYGIPLESPCIPSGDTPLMCAAQSGASNALEFLLRVGANPLALNLDGNSALHIASSLGETNVVRLLLDQNVPQLTKNHNGDLPIHLASYFGHTEVIKLLVAANPIVVKYVNSQKFLPLQLAAINHQRQAIPVLLQYGNPDLTLKDNYGMTPFHFASISGSEALVRRHLVEIFELASRRRLNGSLVDIVNATDKTGYSPVHWSALCPTPDVFGLFCLDTGGGDLDALTSDSSRHTILHLLAGTNNIAALTFYRDRVLHQGRMSSPFLADARGFTPLTLAVNNSHVDFAQILLLIANSPVHECSVLASRESGLSLLHLAVYRRNLNMVKLLLSNNAPINALTCQGETALDWAVVLKAQDIVDFLIQNKAM